MSSKKKLNVNITNVKGKTISKKVITLTAEKNKNKKKVTLKQIKKIYDFLINKKLVDESSIYIQVMAHKELTLKALGDEDFKDWSNDEYFENRANDSARGALNDFEYARIVVMN